MKRTYIALLSVTLMVGCSIKQQVDPAQLSPELVPEICMIAAPGVREGFTNAYREDMQNKGFTVRALHAGASPSLCPLSTTYTGTWKWDMALYMSYAEMRVFQHGAQVGVAIYDARDGSGRLDKFISAESKIHELADQLFPHGAVGLGQAVTLTSTEQTKASIDQQVQELQQQKLPYQEYMRRYREITESSAQ